MKVLLVEDETLVRRFIKSLICWEDSGFTITGEASNGEEAWQFLEHQAVDIVLTDIRMPAMDGFELIRRIREKQLPCEVIILSSYDDYEYVRSALKLQVSDYVHKATVTAEELTACLNHAKREWLSRQEHLLYYRSFDQMSLSREGAVGASLLSLLLEQSVEPRYLELLGQNLTPWNEPFEVALADKKGENGASMGQTDGDIVMLPYEQYWIIAGRHGVREFAESRLPELTIVFGGNRITLTEWPALFEALTIQLAEKSRMNDRFRSYHVSIREAAVIMQERYMDEISLESISDQVHVSPSYLSRLFQKETGQTFTDYLTSIRINQAQTLLLGTELPVYDIAERVGYRNSRYFLKLFKETVGCTPTEFRERNKAK